MSSLLHIKGIILTHMTAEPELKEAVMDILNSMDNDLDACSYDEDLRSDPTIDAIERLDKVLTDQDVTEEKPKESDVVISREQLFDADTEESQS